MKRYRASLFLYRLLLQLYPGRFRRRFSESMSADFEEMLGSGGSRFRCWIRVLVDLVRSVPRERLRERPIVAPRTAPWSGLLQELRHVVRGLAKAPTFTIVSILTLALGVGATTAIFSLVRATLLEPLPFASPERLVALWEHATRSESRRNSISPANYRDWKLRSSAFEAMAAHNHGYDTVTGDGMAPEMVPVGLVEPDFFSVLGVAPMIGRDFQREEATPENHFVVLLSAEYWRRRFGGDPAILGKTLTIEREPYEIIGVMSKGPNFPEGVALWRPLALEERRWTEQRGGHFLGAVARLAPGVTLDEARAEMDAIAAHLAVEYPDTNEGWGATVVSLHDDRVADVRPSLLLLQAAVLLVLAIACVNVAGLQVGRADRRRGEIAIRAALGAGTARLTRLLLVESTLLSLVGGALALLVALMILAVLRPLAPVPMPEIELLLLEEGVLGFAVAVALGSGLLFGVATAVATAGNAGSRALQEVGRGAVPRSRTREWLVTTEVALSLVLLVGSGLFLKSFYRLVHVDSGVDTENVLSLRVSIPRAEYDEPIERVQFFDMLHARLSELPGVRSAALTSLLPISGSPGWWRNSFYRPEHPPETPAEQVNAYLRWVSPDYMKTVGIPLLRGRDLDGSDTAESKRVLLIDEAMAREFFPGEDPLGKRIVVEYNDWQGEIVGIVGNTRQTSLWDDHDPHMYVPYRQTYREMYLASMVAVLRTEGDPNALAGPARDVVRSLDAFVAPVEVETLTSRLSKSVTKERFQLTLVSAFAVLALSLAIVGLYGVIAYIVSQRRREMGVRMALGAGARDVLMLVLRRGGVLIGSGILVGLVAAAGLGKLVAPFLFDVSATDTTILVVASAVLLLVALSAVWLPARSAARVDPVSVLRCE